MLFIDSSTIVTGGYSGPMNVLKVGSSGIVSAVQIPGTAIGPELPLAASGNIVFTSNSRLWDVQSLQMVGQTGISGPATFLPGRSRLLVVAVVNNYRSVVLAAFDQATLTPFGEMMINVAPAGVGNSLTRLIPWDSDGIAFVCGQQLCLGHTPLAGPAPTWTSAGTINAASGAAGAVAPGEILSIFGSTLGTAAGRALEFSGARKVSSALGGTQVWFGGLAGTMLYAGSGQVNVVAPFGLAGKPSTKVQIWYGGIPSAAITLPVTAIAPGVFTQDGSGRGPAALLNSDGQLNTASHAAAAGSWATLFGTGGGVTQPGSNDGVPANAADALTAPVRVLLNGQAVPVLYSGSAPGLVAGVVQVNFTIPPGFSASSTVTLQLEIGGVASPANVTMAVR